ncbi:unnamed protein product [Caenorhabditis nigoni]
MSSLEKRVFLDMALDEKPIGRIEIKLFTSEAPKTCENFRALCTGELGMAPNNKARLHYKGNEIHRVVKKFMIQGGDITDGDGRGGFSIYGRYFDDEKFVLKHSKPYLLSMANKGPNSNSSQFFITTAPAPHCNGKHVVFGEVIKGREVVDVLDNLEVDEKSKPIAKVRIFNSGELVKKKKPSKTEEELAALEERKRQEAKKDIPDIPKSWLYRDNEKRESDFSSKTERARVRSRSRSPSNNYETRRNHKGDFRGDRNRRTQRADRKDDFGIAVRGRGGVQFRRERSVTPEHWRRHAPSKWQQGSYTHPVDLQP